MNYWQKKKTSRCDVVYSFINSPADWTYILYLKTVSFTPLDLQTLPVTAVLSIIELVLCTFAYKEASD
jgi:hypothetical protein